MVVRNQKLLAMISTPPALCHPVQLCEVMNPVRVTQGTRARGQVGRHFGGR